MRSAVVLTIVLAWCGLARAEDAAKADKIFEEAQQLKAQGKPAEACQKYEESLSYNRNAVGTLLNVGLCAEQAGKFATAVKHYTLARDLAREHSLDEHHKAAEERLAKVSPNVAHLAIAFAEKAPNMKLVIGEEIVSIDRTDDIVLDPGTHHVVVSAPGRVSYEQNIELEQGKAKAVAVPKLGYPVTVNRGRKTVGKIFTIGGAAVFAAGVGIGVYAWRKYENQIGPHCSDTSPPMCDQEGLQAINSANSWATFGTIVGAAGVVATGVGVYLWMFGPKASAERNVAIVPQLTPESVGLSAVGRF